MINIWFLLGLVPTYRMGNGCNAIQNRLSSGRAFVCFACYVCVRECVCEYKGPVTACVWPGEIKEQIGLQITTAPQRAMAPVWLSPPPAMTLNTTIKLIRALTWHYVQVQEEGAPRCWLGRTSCTKWFVFMRREKEYHGHGMAKTIKISLSNETNQTRNVPHVI